MWGATCVCNQEGHKAQISIHAPRVGSDTVRDRIFLPSIISIHAPRVGSDYRGCDDLTFSGISIHAPRVGSDEKVQGSGIRARISIHAPRVGSDSIPQHRENQEFHFNPRSPCGERHSLIITSIQNPDFNPRSPCGERRARNRLNIMTIKFQSTLPVWGATSPYCSGTTFKTISIHAPRVGSDWEGKQTHLNQRYFNPRSPCGERP